MFCVEDAPTPKTIPDTVSKHSKFTNRWAKSPTFN